jgi:hypothetical protein
MEEVKLIISNQNAALDVCITAENEKMEITLGPYFVASIILSADRNIILAVKREQKTMIELTAPFVGQQFEVKL